MLTTQLPLFKPGFRLSLIDCIVILLAIVGIIHFYEVDKVFSYIIGIIVSHYFLFCNITRMSRVPELIWASSFIILCTLSLQLNIIPIFISFIFAMLITVVLVVLETRKPYYHGVFWQKLNPSLPSWFKENNSK